MTTGGWGVSCCSAGQHSQAAAGRAQQSSVRALPHACRRSSGVERVLDVRIDWHVKRPTINKVKHRAVQSQTGGGQSDDSRSSARSCSCWGALEQRAAWSYCLRLQTPWGSARVREMWRHRVHQRSTLVKREGAVAGLVSEGLALVSGSAGTGSSTVVVPTPMDPLEFRKSTRDLKALSAAKEHTNEERGGGRDPGVRRPGAGRGRKIFFFGNSKEEDLAIIHSRRPCVS